MAKFQGYATRKETDKARDKKAKVAQQWLQKGFTPEQVASAIYNKTGQQTFVENGVVCFYGRYNDEKCPMYVTRKITATSIEKFTN